MEETDRNFLSNTGSVREDFRRQLHWWLGFQQSQGKRLAMIIGVARKNPRCSSLPLPTSGCASRRSRANLTARSPSWRVEGDFSEVAVDALYGPLYFRLLIEHGTLSLTAWTLCDLVMTGLVRRSVNELAHLVKRPIYENRLAEDVASMGRSRNGCHLKKICGLRGRSSSPRGPQFLTPGCHGRLGARRLVQLAAVDADNAFINRNMVARESVPALCSSPNRPGRRKPVSPLFLAHSELIVKLIYEDPVLILQ
jgi:hypothetical protein